MSSVASSDGQVMTLGGSWWEGDWDLALCIHFLIKYSYPENKVVLSHFLGGKKNKQSGSERFRQVQITLRIPKISERKWSNASFSQEVSEWNKINEKSFWIYQQYLMMSSEQLYVYSKHALTKNNGNTIMRRRRKSGTTNLLNMYFLPGVMYKASSGPSPLISNSQEFYKVGSIMDPIFRWKTNRFKVPGSEWFSLYNRLTIELNQHQRVWLWKVYTSPLYYIKARMLLLAGRIK